MTIPASYIVSGNPGVISSGGNPLALNGALLTKNLRLPAMSAMAFASADAVGAFFGTTSDEYAMAKVYFAGFEGKTQIPGALYFAPYVDTARAAWLRSGSLAGVSLTQLQAFSGTLIVTVDGQVFTSSNISLATAVSFTDAASKISAGFTGTGKPTCTWDALTSTFSLTSSTTGATSTMSYATGTMSTELLFTSATGAILSQGDDVDTPASAMNMLKGKTQNWAAFSTVWEPLLADKEAFAVWVGGTNNRYGYVPWDSDAQAIVGGSTTCFGAIAKSLKYTGVLPVYNTAALAAFVLGTMASIDFSRKEGRITFAAKSQSGFVPTVTDEQIAANLQANGYSFYGSFATDNDQFNFFFDGATPDQWKFFDTYVDQIRLNSQFQLANMVLMTSVNSIPYNEAGYSLIRAAFGDPIREALNFGSIRKGVALSTLQAAEVNQAAGVDAASIIQQTGYYLQILDPGAQVRGLRGSPVINFWYTDGGAVHKISFASTDIL